MFIQNTIGPHSYFHYSSDQKGNRTTNASQDLKLQQEVMARINDGCECLMKAENLSVCDIEAIARQGDVTLNGKVECGKMQRLACDLARTVPGVGRVICKLEISGNRLNN